MEMQENKMQKIPSDIMQMITYEAFCRFKASRQGKSAMAAYDWKVQEVVAARKYYSGWYHCWAKHITGGLVMDSYYLRIKDLDRISFHSRESVDTAVYHVIPGKNPDDLKYNLDYINRKEIEALADQSGCIYLFNKCVGRVRRIQCETVRYDIVIRNGTDAIADSALADNYQIGSVTLPDSVTVIGTGALERSRLLEKVTLSQNLKYIKDAAFRFCWRLQNVDLPDGLLYIGADAFRKCHEFTEMIIPDSVTYIGSKAFYKCVNLKSVKLPLGEKKITDLNDVNALLIAYETEHKLPVSMITSISQGDKQVYVYLGTFDIKEREKVIEQMKNYMKFMNIDEELVCFAIPQTVAD